MSNPLRFAIDPGKTLGYAFETQERTFKSGFCALDKKDPSLWKEFANRPLIFQSFLDQTVPHYIEQMVLESKGAWGGGRVPLMHFTMYQVTLILWSFNNGKQTLLLDVNTIKTIISGNATSNKELIKRILSLEFNLDNIKNHNEVDAISVLYAAQLQERANGHAKKGSSW